MDYASYHVKSFKAGQAKPEPQPGDVWVEHDQRTDIYNGIPEDSIEDFGFWAEDAWSGGATLLRAIHVEYDTRRVIYFEYVETCDNCGGEVRWCRCHEYQGNDDAWQQRIESPTEEKE